MNPLFRTRISPTVHCTPRAQPIASATRLITAAVAFLLLATFPDLALAQDIISERAESALEWIRRAVYFILIVAVLGSGVMAAFGRMSWGTVGQVLIGAIVAGLATEVVDALYGA